MTSYGARRQIVRFTGAGAGLSGRTATSPASEPLPRTGGTGSSRSASRTSGGSFFTANHPALSLAENPRAYSCIFRTISWNFPTIFP